MVEKGFGKVCTFNNAQIEKIMPHAIHKQQMQGSTRIKSHLVYKKYGMIQHGVRHMQCKNRK